MRRCLLVAVALLVALGAPAAAHGETGTMEVLTAEAVEGLTVRLEVGVLHEDGDIADEATVTATLSHVDGTTVGPVDLPPIGGARYGTVVELPTAGEWTLRATSTRPAAEASATFTVEPDAPATTLADEEGQEAPDPALPEADEVAWTSLLVPGLVLLAVLALYVGYRRGTR